MGSESARTTPYRPRPVLGGCVDVGSKHEERGLRVIGWATEVKRSRHERLHRQSLVSTDLI